MVNRNEIAGLRREIFQNGRTKPKGMHKEEKSKSCAEMEKDRSEKEFSDAVRWLETRTTKKVGKN